MEMLKTTRLELFKWVLGILFFSSCGAEVENIEQYATVNNTNNSILNLKEKVYLEGDVEAYKELSIIYMDYPEEDFLFWALIMANKHDYANAYLDVYHSIHSAMWIKEEKDFEIDSLTDYILMNYLELAVNKDADGAEEFKAKYERERSE